MAVNSVGVAAGDMARQSNSARRARRRPSGEEKSEVKKAQTRRTSRQRASGRTRSRGVSSGRSGTDLTA